MTPTTPREFEKALGSLIVAHNRYIDGVWRGQSDLNNPPQTAAAIIAAHKRELVRELQEVLDTLLPKGVSSNPRDYVRIYSETVNDLHTRIQQHQQEELA